MENVIRDKIMKRLLNINASRIVNSILLLIGLLFFKPLAYFVALMMFLAGLTNYCLMEKILQRLGFQNTCSTMSCDTEMKVYDVKEHWETIYQTKKSNEVSWHQEMPKTSLNLISEAKIDKNAKIIDIGGGDSNLVDNLLAIGFRNITVLDISSNALSRAKKRLRSRANNVKWIVFDLREFETNDKYDLWHDRAVLHFLTEEDDIRKYVEKVKQLLKPNGYLIVSTFSKNGPKKCSGLDIKQYSEESIKELFSGFEHIKSFEEKHLTPWDASQIFISSVFRKCSEKCH